jgi:hypothetical protein
MCHIPASNSLQTRNLHKHNWLHYNQNVPIFPRFMPDWYTNGTSRPFIDPFLGSGGFVIASLFDWHRSCQLVKPSFQVISY